MNTAQHRRGERSATGACGVILPETRYGRKHGKQRSRWEAIISNSFGSCRPVAPDGGELKGKGSGTFSDKTKTVKDPNDLTTNTITYQYDLLGRLYKVTDNTGTTKNTYDKAGRLIRVEYPGSMTVSYLYDASSNRTRLTYPDATYITYDYDELGRMTAVRNSSGTALASYSFDDRSRRTALDYTNGAGADYSYDAASRLLSLDNSTGNGQHKYGYMYDNVGNRTSMMVTDSSGTRTHVYSYDDIYQITAVDYPSGFDYLATDTTFNYDAAGNRSSVIDGSGTCTYTANSLNQYTAAGTVDYQYDASGNMTYDERFLYSYDPENRLIQVKKTTPADPWPALQPLDSFSAYTTGGDAVWAQDADFAHSGTIGDDQESWLQIQVQGPGTVRFDWKVSSGSGDYLNFYVDGWPRDWISGEVGWQSMSHVITSAGTHTLKWRYAKGSSGSGGLDRGWVRAVTWQPTPSLAEAVDSSLAYTTGGDRDWYARTLPWVYYRPWAAFSGDLDPNQSNWLQTTVQGGGVFSFSWKTESSDSGSTLTFQIDGQTRDTIYGNHSDWQPKTYTITGAGTHTLKWTFSRSSNENTGAAYVDHVVWRDPALPVPEPASDAWQTLTYTYDAGGRRIAKAYDGQTITTYVYDGDHCIAEYDPSSGNLRRKYIYGPGVDQPVCMIEATVSPAATYYYHFDALGSVVALTNSSGNTVEVYEYDVYGRVGASDANHPNRFLFTGREFDKETGLYYYRARYYNPQIGRFLQTDPVGYGDGLGWYAYCGNSPTGRTDPSGLWASYTFQWVNDDTRGPRLRVEGFYDNGVKGASIDFEGWSDMWDYVNGTGQYKTPGDFCDGNFDRAAFTGMARNLASGPDPYANYSPSGGGATGGWGDSSGDYSEPLPDTARGAIVYYIRGGAEGACMGVAGMVNAATGGLFYYKNGLLYMLSDGAKGWSVNPGFRTGQNCFRVFEGCMMAVVIAKAVDFDPWLGKIEPHGPHAGGPHQYPHLQIMIRIGAHTTAHIRLPIPRIVLPYIKLR